jgi:hypothetical protein
VPIGSRSPPRCTRTRPVTIEQEADVFILVCGAVETARLMLLSKTTRFPNGIANGIDMVGRNVTFHDSSAIGLFNDRSTEFYNSWCRAPPRRRPALHPTPACPDGPLLAPLAAHVNGPGRTLPGCSSGSGRGWRSRSRRSWPSPGWLGFGPARPGSISRCAGTARCDVVVGRAVEVVDEGGAGDGRQDQGPVPKGPLPPGKTRNRSRTGLRCGRGDPGVRWSRCPAAW